MEAWTGNRIDENLRKREEEIGKLTYKTLADYVGDMILCNNIIDDSYHNELFCGEEYDYFDEEWNEISKEKFDEMENNGERVNIQSIDFYQYFIISDSGAEWLKENTNETVYYNNNLNVYFWAISHFGTSWDYVFSDTKCVTQEEFLKQF